MTSIILTCKNNGRLGFVLENSLNGKAYGSNHYNRRNETFGAFITDEIRSSPQRTVLFLEYLSTAVNFQKMHGFDGLIIGGKPFFDRTLESVKKVTPLIKSNNWMLDGRKMNEDMLFKIAAAAGLDIKENWHAQGDGNWNSSNSYTVTYLPTFKKI
jgi:hypothetical protein